MLFDKLFGKSNEERAPDIDFIIGNFRRSADRLVAVSDIEELRKLFSEYTADATLQWPGYEDRILNAMEDELADALRAPRKEVKGGWFDDI